MELIECKTDIVEWKGGYRYSGSIFDVSSGFICDFDIENEGNWTQRCILSNIYLHFDQEISKSDLFFSIIEVLKYWKGISVVNALGICTTEEINIVVDEISRNRWNLRALCSLRLWCEKHCVPEFAAYEIM